ncbi:restriction endonuclease type II-like protein [Chaetomidium leptoderma]|uniref:Restriction endonuclease type II-like protein n=1 Tax=Chaetomidium leptoderma TaxID=669021 RepID=A0AAN6VDQ9_9PEZI|nr:restriction endonuclease type II-like protein [Chaetomidium leptoderma]
MDDDEYGDADADDILAALAAAEAGPSRPAPAQQPPQPGPRIQQPTPQRLDGAPPANASGTGGAPKVVQPTPQALPARGSGSSILVSPRQKGNPVLACLKSVAWEYSDILADYGLGATTCALFLSLKYHRLHPEYIYTRIRNLQGKYNLRIVLALVDIPNHEDALRELSKTSLVNNVTVILAWSAAEAARYLELYKSYEHAGFAAIRGQQASGYAERLVEFVTVPRTINKTDAVALVSSFGSLRHAVNAEPEQIGVVGGWGEKKVRAWCKAVEEPFRVRKAGKSGVAVAPGAPGASRGGDGDGAEEDAEALVAQAQAEAETAPGSARQNQPVPARTASVTAPSLGRNDDQLSDGIAAALARLRDKG